jgi:thioredoxin reductase
MTHHDSIIVGAGPAGLQMAYFLEQAHRDSLILEASDTAGSFFASQPRHRTLISLNKRFNVYPEDDYNMRFDWNSLLTDDYGHLFRSYSPDLYPHADHLLQYLRDFADKYDLKIRYNTRINAIARGAGEAGGFVLTDEAQATYHCDRLLMATGAVGPYVPDIEGIELAEGYEHHDIDRTRFENKRVLIIGRGNSAFEVANHLAGHAGLIHIAVGDRPPTHAWQTHFVGDLRAINNTVIEMYQLKSLHSTLGFEVKTLTRQADGTVAAYMHADVPNWTRPGTLKITLVYDHVIRCTGWTYTTPALFAPDVVPAMDARTKFPLVNARGESSVPGLFYIGTAAAGRERRAASGFIHGFRYTIRTLFRLLEERDHGVPLPSRQFSLRDREDLEKVAESILLRLSQTSALYQLFGVLTDVLVFAPGTVTLFPELPVADVLERETFTSRDDIVLMTLEYGFHHYPAEASALDFIFPTDDPDARDCTAFLHAIFRHYCRGALEREVHLGESLVIRYDAFGRRWGPENRDEAHKNTVMNLLNRIARVTTETFPETILRDFDGSGFEPWTEEQRLRRLSTVPGCVKGGGHGQ